MNNTFPSCSGAVSAMTFYSSPFPVTICLCFARFPSSSSIFCLNSFLQSSYCSWSVFFFLELQKRFYPLKFEISLITISNTNPTNYWLHSKLSLRDKLHLKYIKETFQSKLFSQNFSFFQSRFTMYFSTYCND